MSMKRARSSIKKCVREAPIFVQAVQYLYRILTLWSVAKNHTIRLREDNHVCLNRMKWKWHLNHPLLGYYNQD